MADWFKLYENDLFDERLQWIMETQQQSAIVWVAMLTRCCREKSGNLKWNGSSYELLSLAKLLHVQPGSVSQAITLLAEIEFIKLEPGMIVVPRWREIQSEYCQKKQGKSRQCPDTIPTVSAQIRKDKNKAESGLPERDDARPPRLSRVMKKAAVNGATKENT